MIGRGSTLYQLLLERAKKVGLQLNFICYPWEIYDDRGIIARSISYWKGQKK